jgi:hypothetical protein
MMVKSRLSSALACGLAVASCSSQPMAATRVSLEDNPRPAGAEADKPSLDGGHDNPGVVHILVRPDAGPVRADIPINCEPGVFCGSSNAVSPAAER